MLPHISASEIFLRCTILILSILCVSAHSSISNPGWTCVVRNVQCSSKRHWQQSMDKINMVHPRKILDRDVQGLLGTEKIRIIQHHIIQVLQWYLTKKRVIQGLLSPEKFPYNVATFLRGYKTKFCSHFYLIFYKTFQHTKNDLYYHQ